MTDQQYETLTVERTDGVARVTISGTSKMNTLTLQTTRELEAASSDLVEDDDVGCIVLTGEGENFGAGADLSQFAGDETDAPHIRQLATSLHNSIVQLHLCEKPILTAVSGVAAGAGFSLAIGGDVVLVREDARLKFAYPGVGLTGDGGATYFLPRLVGLRNAREIALLDEPIDAERAVDLGLATEVVARDEFDARVDDRATELTARPTEAIGTTKRLLFESYDRDLAGHLSAETNAITEATRGEEYREGIAPFLDE